MIKYINNQFVIFEWEDGETHCLPINEYNHFAKLHGLRLV